MSCGNQKKHDTINTVIGIAGGVAIGTVAVAAIVAAPLEIGLTLALAGATKFALNKHNSHTHEEETVTVNESE